MTRYVAQPAQFRLPGWAHEFLAEESQARAVTKTQVLLEALECLRDSRRASALTAGYSDLRDVMLEEAEEWSAGLPEDPEAERW